MFHIPLSAFSPFMTVTLMCQRRDIFAKNVLSSFKAETQPAGHLFSTGMLSEVLLPSRAARAVYQTNISASPCVSFTSEPTELSCARMQQDNR